MGFYLEDATGRVRVDPRQAELDLRPQGETVRDSYVEGGNPYINSVAAGTAMPRFIKAKFPGAEGDSFSQARPSEEERRASQFRLEGQLARSAQGKTSADGLSFFERLKQGGIGGRFRLTEYCIVPGLAYHISGTCAENPCPRDEHARNMILKGKNEPTFVISYRTEKATERDSRDRALKMIFGGAAVSIFSLALILGKLRLF